MKRQNRYMSVFPQLWQIDLVANAKSNVTFVSGWNIKENSQEIVSESLRYIDVEVQKVVFLFRVIIKKTFLIITCGIYSVVNVSSVYIKRL